MRHSIFSLVVIVVGVATYAQCEAPRPLHSPSVPAGDVQPITPPVPVVIPTPAPTPSPDVVPVPTPDPLTQPFTIVATVGETLVDSPVVQMLPGDMLRMTLTGSVVMPKDGAALPDVAWSTNRKPNGFSDVNGGHYVTFCSRGDSSGSEVWLFEASINNPDPLKRPVIAQRWVVVGTLPVPVPPGPVPPVPPGPTPPGPNPIPIAGFHALIIEETDDRDDIPVETKNVILATASGSFRDYLRSHCVKDGAFVLDKDDDVSLMPEWVQAAFKAKGATTPWLIMGNEANGFNGPLPATTADALKIAKPIGGE